MEAIPNRTPQGEDHLEGGRIQQASSNWGLYKALTKGKKAWRDDYMARSQSASPVGDIEQHFEEIFRDEGVVDVHKQLENMVHGITEGKRVDMFSSQEVVQAVMKGKNGRAVGHDLVPNEVPKALVQDETSLAALCCFYSDILTSGVIPKRWDKAVATLIPKLLPPVEAKQLRPITLSSHIAKTFARLLLRRMDSWLRPQGPKQFACSGRQPAEMAWLTSQVVHLSRE